MMDLRRHLNRLAVLLRLMTALRSLLGWVLVSGCLLAALAVAARLGAPAWALPVTLVLVGLTFVVALVRTLGRDLRRRQVAVLIERHDPSLRELVLSATELADAPGRRDLFSAELLAALMTRAEQAVREAPRDRLLEVRRLRPLVLLASVSLALCLSLTLTYRDSLAAMLHMSGELPAATRLVPRHLLPPATPLLSGVRLRVIPPAYTGLPLRDLGERLERVRAPEGSRIDRLLDAAAGSGGTVGRGGR